MIVIDNLYRTLPRPEKFIAEPTVMRDRNPRQVNQIAQINWKA